MVLTRIVLSGLVLSSARGYNSDAQNVAKGIDHTIDQFRRRLDDSSWEAVGRACQPEAGTTSPPTVRNAASLEACQALCEAEPECKAVEFDKDDECLLHSSLDRARTAAEGQCTEYNCCYVHTNKCDTIELSNFILNTRTCDELKDVQMDCMFDDRWTAKEAMAFNAVYCKMKFDSHADYITYLKECSADASKCDKDKDSPDASDSSSPEPPCNKQQLNMLLSYMLHYHVETCDQLYKMLAQQAGSEDFPKCDPGTNIQIGDPSDCTDETVLLIKKRLQENIAKAKDTRGQLGSSLSDSEDPSAATRHTYGGALFASLVMSAALATMLL